MTNGHEDDLSVWLGGLHAPREFDGDFDVVSGLEWRLLFGQLQAERWPDSPLGSLVTVQLINVRAR